MCIRDRDGAVKGERNVKKRRLWKKWSVFCAAMATTLLLSGCMFALSPDDLYSLPKLPEEYVDLEQEIAALVDSGYEYACLLYTSFYQG